MAKFIHYSNVVLGIGLVLFSFFLSYDTIYGYPERLAVYEMLIAATQGPVPGGLSPDGPLLGTGLIAAVAPPICATLGTFAVMFSALALRFTKD